MRPAVLFVFICILITSSNCHREKGINGVNELSQELLKIINDAPGTIGIAFVSDKDTICFNNGVQFPMMSVFKLHQSIATIHSLEAISTPLDTLLLIKRGEIDENTWSPMLKDYSGSEFYVSVKELLKYTIESSDNNASNILFKRIISPDSTNLFIKSIAQDSTFSIACSESQMKEYHDLSYYNFTSPLSAALLIRQVFNDSLCLQENQEFLQEALLHVTTGSDRLGAILSNDNNLFFAHKTGSGYRNSRNELIAHNDIGYFRLPDNQDYALAVFIRDFHGTENKASSIMASISAVIYSYITSALK